jgi:hypothetical protein
VGMSIVILLAAALGTTLPCLYLSAGGDPACTG